MKKRIIGVVLVAIVLAVGGIGAYNTFIKSDDDKIIERLETFETAYAGGDLDGCLECFDTKSRNALKGFGKVSSALGYGIGDLFSGMFSIGVAAQNEQVKFEVEKIHYTDETHAEVTAKVWTSEDYLYKESTSEETIEI